MHNTDAAEKDVGLSRPAAALWIFLGGVLPYLSVLRHGYYLGDDLFILSAVKTRSFQELLSFNLGNTFIRPLGLLFWKLQYLTFGMDPAPQYYVSVSLNILNSWLLFLLVERLSGQRRMGFYAGLLFAVFPLHCDPVCWLAAQYDLLCGIFIFGSLLSYSKYRTTEKVRYLVLSAMSLVLALLSKETAVVLPFVLVVMDFIFYQRPGAARRMWAHLPTFFLLALYCTYRYVALGGVGGYSSGGSPNSLTVYAHPLEYARQVLFFTPYHLAGPAFVGVFGAWQIIIVWASSSILISALVLGRERLKASGWKLPAFSLVSAFLFLQPVASMVVYPGGYLYDPRYLYMPSAGYCAFLAWLLYGLTRDLSGRKPVLAAAAAAVTFCAIAYLNATVYVEASKSARVFYAELGKLVAKTDRDYLIYLYDPPMGRKGAPFIGIGPNGFGLMLTKPEKIIAMTNAYGDFWKGVSILKKNPEGVKGQPACPLPPEFRKPRFSRNNPPVYLEKAGGYFYSHGGLSPELMDLAIYFLWYDYSTEKLNVIASNI